MARLHQLFEMLKAEGGSDLHLASGQRPRLRLRGHLGEIKSWEKLSPGALGELLRELVDDADWQEYLETGDLDFAYGLEGVARFRANYLRQEQGPAAVFRMIPEKIATVEQLGLPSAIEALAHLRSGLVLVTGPTGSGKSTTLAAVIDRINSTYEKHVLTIEDPIEFVHPTKKAVFSQREVGRHVPSFAAALKAAVRQDADVILVGEMRDLETISLAIKAAEMGTLVFGTLHTNSAAKTIDRLVDAFPPEEQPQIRTTLAESIVGIVSQLLLPTADGKGRVAAFEILLKASGVANLIREGNTPMLVSVIQGGKGQGMRLMDDSLVELVQGGRVTAAEALRRAADRASLEKALGMAPSA
ncbi:MAG TPA: type IV pilus twitching motility protein PilT [Thermoanaerobaculia bacterium]|nr:type IV pilus twitching motility protein PilT [Thermoanaerobaculia bacterium]